MSNNNLSNNEAQFMQAFQYAPVGMASITPYGVITWANDSFCQLIGYEQEELHGLMLYRITHTDDKLQQLNYLQQLLAGERTNYQQEQRLLHKQGPFIWVRMSISIIKDDKGDIGAFLVNVDSVNEYKAELLHLGEKELALNSITEYCPDIISRHRPDGTLLYVSSASLEVLGYMPVELYECTFLSLVHPDDVEEMRTQQMNALHGHPIRTLPIRLRRKNHSYVWVVTSGNAVTDEYGSVVEVISVTRDISRWTNEEVQNNIAVAISAPFTNPHSIHQDLVFQVDIHGVFISVNEALEKATGYSAAEIIDASMNFRRLIHPDYMDVTVNQFRLITVMGDTVHFRTIGLNKNNKRIVLDIVAVPLYSGGQIIGAYGFARDMGQQMKLWNELKQSRQIYQLISDNAHDMIASLSPDGVILYVSPAMERILGYKLEEVIGTSFCDYIKQDDHHSIHKRSNPLEDHVTYTMQFIHKQGHYVWIESTIRRIRGKTGQIEQIIGVGRDITDRIKTEELMLNSEKLTIAGQLAAGIAHEIRNPITAIKGFLQLMRSGYSEKQRYYDIMSSEIERIELILSELLVLAKPQTSRYERSDICELLTQVVPLLNTQAIMSNVQIVLEFEMEHAYIQCDDNQLKQVCINYIKNAIEAMTGGGELRIQVMPASSGYIVVRFIDQGDGIPEYVLSKMGQPFYTTKEKGTGLGFMVSKKIVESHDGWIRVISKENEGTTIEMTLPSA